MRADLSEVSSQIEKDAVAACCAPCGVQRQHQVSLVATDIDQAFEPLNTAGVAGMWDAVRSYAEMTLQKDAVTAWKVDGTWKTTLGAYFGKGKVIRFEDVMGVLGGAYAAAALAAVGEAVFLMRGHPSGRIQQR